MVEEKLIQSGEIEIDRGSSPGIPGLSGISGISSNTLRGPGKNNILDDPDLDSIMKDIEKLQAGQGADEIFPPPPTKATRSTKYIPPIPTSPRRVYITSEVKLNFFLEIKQKNSRKDSTIAFVLVRENFKNKILWKSSVLL